MSEVAKLFDPFKKVFKINLQAANIDNNVFRIHYRASVIVLLGCATLVGWKEFFMQPIQCMLASEKPVAKEVINTYCWIFPTRTLPEKIAMQIGKDVVQPGVGTPGIQEPYKSHKYYQWVCMTLFLQALIFKVPHIMWKTCEKGRMSNMIKDLEVPLITKESKKARKQLLLDHLLYTFGKQNIYFYRFVFCEVLNFVNVIAQIYFMDLFLDGDFIDYGTQVLDCRGKYSFDCTYPMDRIFPKESKCEFYHFGPSGTIQMTDALCVLPINIVNEKVYIFLWFWFMSVATVTGLMMVYRVFVMISVKMRTYLLYYRAQRISYYFVSYICQKGNIGDWFVLYQLSKNIDTRMFVEIVQDLVEKLESRRLTKASELATEQV